MTHFLNDFLWPSKFLRGHQIGSLGYRLEPNAISVIPPLPLRSLARMDLATSPRPKRLFQNPPCRALLLREEVGLGVVRIPNFL